MEKVRVKQRCAFANLNHELAVPALGYYVKNTPLGMCLPWAGLAKATENVSDAACAADTPSFPKRLPWHERGFLSSRDHDLFWNGDHVSLPQLCNFCGFSAFQSLCLLGMECFCDNCFFHPLLSIRSFPSSFFPLTLVPCTWLLTRSLLLLNTLEWGFSSSHSGWFQSTLPLGVFLGVSTKPLKSHELGQGSESPNPGVNQPAAAMPPWLWGGLS